MDGLIVLVSNLRNAESYCTGKDVFERCPIAHIICPRDPVIEPYVLC
jgi:hypothetical protein